MLRSITFPMHTASENKYRRQHAMISARKTKKQRDEVQVFLRQLPPVPRAVDNKPNRFEVNLIRIAVSELDFSNLVGAFKGIQDEVAAWIGLDDRDPRITWDWLQQPCKKGYYGVRVEVRDAEQREDKIVVLGPTPHVKGPAARSTGRGRARDMDGAADGLVAPRRARSRTPVLVPRARPQEPITFVCSAAVLPWKQDGDELVLTELPALENVEPAPERTEARGPDGSRITITRRGKFRVEPFGTCWLFAPEGQPFDADDWGLERTGDQ